MVETLRYEKNGWDVALPTVKSYTFSDIEKWQNSGSSYPLVLDTNLISGCNVNCMYCSTEGGKQDVRWKPSENLPYLRDNHLEELIEQMADVGTQTFFICSNGEPLLNRDRFLNLARQAYDNGISVVTYTNGSTLNTDFLEKLANVDVSLIMKWESPDATMNDAIILNSEEKRKRAFSGYNYKRVNGVDVPEHLVLAKEVYGKDSGKLGVESMISSHNIHDVLKLREFCYDELNSAQFLKHLYDLGYTAQAGENIKPSSPDELAVMGEIMSFDEAHGFKYPEEDLPDTYSYDARRLMNNLVSSSGFPFRMFIHELGGIYHSSQVISEPFGFGTDNVISVFDEGDVNLKNQLSRISKIVKTD